MGMEGFDNMVDSKDFIESKIALVVPLWDKESLKSDRVQSVLKQDYENLAILLLSSDENLTQNAMEYLNKDSRMQLLHIDKKYEDSMYFECEAKNIAINFFTKKYNDELQKVTNIESNANMPVAYSNDDMGDSLQGGFNGEISIAKDMNTEKTNLTKQTDTRESYKQTDTMRTNLAEQTDIKESRANLANHTDTNGDTSKAHIYGAVVSSNDNIRGGGGGIYLK